MEIRYERTTNKSLEDAITSITNSLKERKFGLLWQVNFKEKMAEHGIDFPYDFVVLEVCNPQKANEVLTKHIEMGYFLPCKVVVYEKDGITRIGTARPKILMSMAGYDDLEAIAIEVEGILTEAIDEAI
ncbi:MAG: DUF302 domain-containing protein [Tissierellia bacterium]|nr:DUF302 domain-containing protein [Tissierellia bacterium]